MKNQYEMAEGEKQEAGINTLPRDMKEALEIFKQSTYMKELLGDHIFNKYVEAKSTLSAPFRVSFCPCPSFYATKASVVSNFSCDSFIKGNPWHNCGLH